MKPEKQLYQWDVNQYLTGINPAAQYVDYKIDNEVIRLETDSTRCRIPDEVLQTYGGKTCYERYPDGTYRAYSFTVLYAPKPPDYVFTPEERTTFEALTARVDAAIDEIKRRADSGDFTPVKGVDYFTDAEKDEMMESVSSGAVGEFREAVNSATADFNRNSSVKTNDYNTNAETKTAGFDSNAAEKQESYNQNHTAKVSEYNQNAETKTAEFDSNAAALQTEVDRLRGECDTLAAEKANIDGYYEEMTVGDAEQLIATQFVEDNEPYLFRPTGGSSDVGNRAYFDKIVGGTVAWNQLVEPPADGSTKTVAGLSITRNSDGSFTLDGTTTQDANGDLSAKNVSFLANHKYLCLSPPNVTITFPPNYNTVKGSKVVSVTTTASQVRPRFYFYSGETFTNQKVYVGVIDLTQMFGSTIADYIYSLERSQAGAGVAWFKKLFPKDYYEYNAGELLSAEGLQSHDTVGFNQWDEALENGGLNAKTGLPFADTNWFRTKNFIPIFPSTTYYYKIPTRAMFSRLYFYDVDKNFVSYSGTSMMNETFTTPQNAHYMKFTLTKLQYGTTYNHDICINLSDPSRNGEYEPYEKHSYPLDSSLTLRGIPKLDASNNLYYDGDEYTSDGKVKRKYGIVDLGTLDWVHENNSFRTTGLYGIVKNYETSQVPNVLTTKYTPVSYSADWVDGIISFTYGSGTRKLVIYDSAYTDGISFKNAMSGVMLVYELATPTTETAEPFHNIQVVDDFGTEEFVSTGIVPAGHLTKYPANLRDKLQHLPNLAGMDGTYLIRQTGKQMSLVHTPAVFPETPTEDGTYTLKTVVTGGVATLQWVVE